MKKFNVGIIGCTGMVGQRFVTLLQEHPWFKIKVLAASARSSGKTYEEACAGRWLLKCPMPDKLKNLKVFDANDEAQKIASLVDFVFCAVNMPKDQIKQLEEKYARLECPVISNNSANRPTADVPMIIPEINPEHAEIIPFQRKRLGTERGFIAVKSNCSLQSYVPALNALKSFGLESALACTYQAISGAGKTFGIWPEILDNVVPYIGGEEEKSETEPLKIWGNIEDGKIVPAKLPSITTQCLRVPVSDGHVAAVFAKFNKKPELDEILSLWKNYKGVPQKLGLPSAPEQFLNYFESDDRPQPKLDRNLGNGMAVSVGRLRFDSQYDIKFVSLSHNTIRGAAGGAILMAELLCAQGYIG